MVTEHKKPRQGKELTMKMETLPLSLDTQPMGKLAALINAGEFVVTTELAPPDSADPAEVIKRAQVFDGFVDAINATDGSGANCHMSSFATCVLLQQHGYSAIMQMSCRDRNRIAMQGDVLGASALGIEAIVFITGDGVQSGDHPGAKPVFDLDSITLMHIVKTMRDDGHYLSGRKLSKSPSLFIGGVDNPFVPEMNFRVKRLAKKIEAGAQFIQTQYCFDVPRLAEYMKKVREQALHKQAAIIVGVGPLASAKSALWMREHVAGVHIPDVIIDRLAAAPNQRREGQQICKEIMQSIRDIDGIAGIHMMAFKHEEVAGELIQDSQVLSNRRIPCVTVTTDKQSLSTKEIA